MKRNSQRAYAFEKFKFSSPEWRPVVIPEAGSGRWAVVMVREDRPMSQATGNRRLLYGQVLAVYKRKALAERLCADLLRNRAELLSRAFP